MPETIFPSLLEFLVTCAVLIVAQLVYVLMGFGSGLITVGSLALLLPAQIQDVVVLQLLVNLPAELLVVWKSRGEIRWKPIAHLGAGIALGIPLGAWLLKAGDSTLVLHILGGFLIAVGLVFLRLPVGGRIPPVWAAPPTGLLSGTLTGLFGTGGPPLIIWYHVTTGTKSAFRGNLMTIFLLMTLVRVPSYVTAGLITTPRLWSMVAVLPAVFVGAWIGHRLHIEISEKRFRLLVSVLLAAIGAMLLVRS